ncbi:Gfo/Idh/MocA family protein [Phytoactinopolyspora halotolerans]|uniref:Gfo/Idh/MocA family oxidoreductase n=1 Tax=Phytoactinopolyspora halotolerans TaxID=1981512 RepID=A0A6L9S611_9ACTN|nr:Gfo/Idh/MocA family oxidoreductase [Phytoactinopolyspora halotolerans]NED99499.1 Gfo/Idh/MocA family oxidoreductase [Phytoactinopolyspora halotolerans]
MQVRDAGTVVALIGVRGFGRTYLGPLENLVAREEARFAGGCDINPEAGADLPAGTVFYDDHKKMLESCHPDITIVATPPHTHFQLAVDALEVGSDVLLEKPPVVSTSQHARLAAAVRSSGRLCQVGFQAMAGEPMQRLLALVADGAIGAVTDIAVTGQWIRLDEYYRRSPWAGHRHLDGIVVADGVSTNPFAHPVMNALAVAQADDPEATPVALEVESYRCRDIATDDTVSARVHLSNGKRIHIALTLCAEEIVEPVVTVHATGGVARLGNTGTTLTIDGVVQDVSAERGRPLDNLLAHRRDPERAPLMVSLERTAAFTAYLEGMLNSPAPLRVPSEFLRQRPEEGSRRVILTGINQAISTAGEELALFSELGLKWARPPASVPLGRAE